MPGISKIRVLSAAAIIFYVGSLPTLAFAEAALAFGQYGNGGWASGTAYNNRTTSEAMASAMNSCNARGYNCSIQITFRKSCIALAVQNSGSGNGWQVHDDLGLATRGALNRCVSYGRSCSIKAAFCDNVSEQEIRAAELENQRRQNEEYQEYVQHWRACFQGQYNNDWDNQISSCNQALGFSRATYTDRNKLIDRRDTLARARDQAQESARARDRSIAEESARQAEERAKNAEIAAQQAEERARNAELSARGNTGSIIPSPTQNFGLHIIPNSNSAIGIGIIFVGFMSWTFSLIAKAAAGEKRVLWREIAVESIAGVISGIVLYKFGIVDEIKWLTLPLAGGLGIALYSSIRHA